ncbi:MAG: Gfo/Idh/MocA family oxidoreductase [Lachnospiraceae bacterium]|jgi:predicted dehydrogenase|nr:Gfo/Idh/MocA family oxidoreductase [Lachnospiraceae bacterium]MCH4030425.1 Gfo/Idh/MocA family oxidoreductase [Lachnospiraceae bacterium]MCH4069637.1 Gfo/Idh/MocA family oxidoreductase [Lachnospiraceae bacterium]MCH4107427.1 Gfo/Idh/MocA family oxidoreductase [Lachnospiraceae bacterium]MCI1301722.1 Gfo/Idh/MocA family oxidoreductase [Lachnospiraceae bacterium]
MKKKFVIIGAGWRAMYYVRAAREHPESYAEPLVYCRNPDKCAALKETEHVRCSSDLAQCLSEKPDFLVLAIPKEANFAMIRRLEDTGLPMLVETPPAIAPDDLQQLWYDSVSGRLHMMAAEQYLLNPSLAAVKKAADSGKIGDPYYMRLSRAHGYHGASLIRFLLRVRSETAVITGRRMQEPLLVTGRRPGVIRDGIVEKSERDFIRFEFENGKIADYDFDSAQYHSAIRRYHLLLQGERGEICDQHILYARDTENGRIFCEEDFSGNTRYQNWIGTDDDPDKQVYEEDYTAIAMLMESMEAVAGGEDGLYPLADALQDSYFWLLMQEAAEKEITVQSTRQPWQDALERSARQEST